MSKMFNLSGILLVVGLVTAGCVTDLPTRPEQLEQGRPVVFGRAVAVLTGDRGRRYGPAIRSFELLHQDSRERFWVDVRSDDQLFVLQLPPGEYQLTRVQINEGPFLSMADFEVVFRVEPARPTYLGTWRFGVDSPRYGRKVVVSAVQDEQTRSEAEREMLTRYPDLDSRQIATVLPLPAEAESRLYEVMPYPRYPRYFRRHWW